MKKVVLLVGCLIILAVGIVSVSCEKEKREEWRGCSCNIRFDDGYRETETISAAEAKSKAGANNCAELEFEILDNYYDYSEYIASVTCTPL